MKVKQINNIVIRQTPCSTPVFSCWAGGKCLEQFSLLRDAEKWCRETQDFISRKRKLASYSGNCTDIPNAVFDDATEFAQAEERAVQLSHDQFWCGVREDRWMRSLMDHATYFFDAQTGVYMLYDCEHDVHYFFK